MARVEKERFLEAIKISGGIAAYTARLLGVSRKTVYNRMSSDPDLKVAMWDAKEESLDIAESQLFAKVKEGNLRAIMYLLDNLGRDRGYGYHNSKPAHRRGK